MTARRLLDTNVLLCATDEHRVGHDRALEALAAADGVVCTQVLREYLAVATRPIDANGLGLPLPQALENVDTFVTHLTELPDATCSAGLLPLLHAVETTGKTIHDAHLVATMLHHGVREIVTHNVRNFRRFEPRIRVISLV